MVWSQTPEADNLIAQLGFDVGTSIKWAEFISSWSAIYREPPVAIAEDGTAQPVTVHVHVRLDRLSQISAPTHFEAEISVAMAWEDARIHERCFGVPYVDGKLETQNELCRTFWLPELDLPTALGNDDAAEVLGEQIVSFFPGAAPPRDPNLS